MKLLKLLTAGVAGLIKNIRSRFTMEYDSYYFTDCISGKKVNIYTDCYNQRWMASSRFGSRIKKA